MQEIKVLTESLAFGKKYAYLFIPEKEDVDEWTHGIHSQLDGQQNDIAELRKCIADLKKKNTQQTTEINELRQELKTLTQQQEKKIDQLTLDLKKEFTDCKKELKDSLTPLSSWAKDCSQGQDKKITDLYEKTARMEKANEALKNNLTTFASYADCIRKQETELKELTDKITRMEGDYKKLADSVENCSEQSKSIPSNPDNEDRKKPFWLVLFKKIVSRFRHQ